MPVYRYKLAGLDIEAVKNQVPPADASSVSGGAIASLVVWDITAPATSKDDIDDYLAGLGWTFVETDPSTTPEEAAAASPGNAWNEDEFIATLGQITFILSQAPIDSVSLTVGVNGLKYDDTSDFTVSGTTVTWLNTLFSMDAGDQVIIRYK